MSGQGRQLVSLALGIWASALFVVLWAGFAVNAANGGQLAASAWQALTALPPVAEAAVWVLCLPVTVALWASQAALSGIAGPLVVLGLALWTAVAWAGLARALRARRTA